MMNRNKNAFDFTLVLKIGLSAGELGAFIGIIVFGVQVITNLSAEILQSTVDVLLFPAFQGLCISGLLFIFFPVILRYVLYLVRLQIYAWHAQIFRKQFLTHIKGMQEIDTKEMQAEFQVTPEEIDKAFENALRSGLLRGSYDRRGGNRVFITAPGFEILSEEERKWQDFVEGLPKFSQAYAIVSIDRLAQTFGLSRPVVEKELMNQIADGKVKGHIELENFVRQ